MLKPEQRLQLASKSPRRREILDQIGVKYDVVSAPIDETINTDESALAYVTRLAEKKAARGYSKSPNGPTLGSDTIVELDGNVFGKPKDEADARAMLEQLSSSTHKVLTAVAICDGQDLASLVSQSSVRFRAISGEEISRYWATQEPRDKAGGYAIQGKGAVFVEELRGSYSGVMGLPILETSRLLARFGIPYWNDND